VEWSTKSVRDAFFASPIFPRLLNGDAIKETIIRGVNSGMLAYVGKKGEEYDPFIFGGGLNSGDVEISGEMFIISKDIAEKYKSGTAGPKAVPGATQEPFKPYTGAEPVKEGNKPDQQPQNIKSMV
jgi:hypothetical protein